MFDLLILSINKTKYSKMKSDNICIKGLNKLAYKRPKYYYAIWPFINNGNGIMYKLFGKEKYGNHECCDDMFEFDYEVDNSDELYVLQSFNPGITDNCANDWNCMKLKDSYKEEFIGVFDKILDSSPNYTVAFLASGQSNDKEIVIGNILRDDFIDMLETGKVKTNVCYLIKKYEENIEKRKWLKVFKCFKKY